MLAPFFTLAAQSPSRQATLRKLVAVHVALLMLAVLIFARQTPGQSPVLLGHMLLVAGIVEGALLVGWRLTQLPRSQALEFMLVSPVQPRWVFLGEALVGLTHLMLVTLSGLPALAIFAVCGTIDLFDLAPLTLLPLTCGAITGLGLTVWAYEPRPVRKVAELITLFLVLLYLVVGVLAGENLRYWVEALPDDIRVSVLSSFMMLHTHNPFGTLQHWLESEWAAAWERVVWLQVGCSLLVFALMWRAASRLLGHFHERHYTPVRDVSSEVRPPVGDRPLAWWAVKRVSEYSGRINLYLAGGFCLLYAAYIIAAQHWPAWMGRQIFAMCDNNGGPAMLAAALVILGAVPASFQYGLWDSSVQARCKRLELLLMTELHPHDYWEAACAAAWKRGRGYFAIALMLWIAALVGGRISFAGFFTSVAAAALLWALYFALGFRAFARGEQANGLGMVLTVGLPIATVALVILGGPVAANWLPPGMVYSAQTPSLLWLAGPLAVSALTLIVARRTLAECDKRLRQWYDENAGSKVFN